MLLDAKQRPWIVATSLLAVAATVVYFVDAPRHLTGPSGSTAVGLTLGIIAYGIMLFCAALGLKRRVPHWRLGRAQTWLRAHVWLGLLIVVLVALHAAFALGGPFTAALWVMLILVTVSGLVGIFIQQSIPRVLLHSLRPLPSMNPESPAQQVKEMIADCSAQAEKTVIQYAGSLDKPAPVMPAVVAAPAAPAAPVAAAAPVAPNPPTPAAALAPAAAPVAAAAAPATSTAVATAVPPKPAAPAPVVPAKPAAPAAPKIGPPMGGEPVRQFYLETGRAFWAGEGHSPLENPTLAVSIFAALKAQVPLHTHQGVDDLEELAARRRQLLIQRRWMKALHGWLIFHVPLSWGFIVAVAVHAVFALRYWGAK